MARKKNPKTGKQTYQGYYHTGTKKNSRRIRGKAIKGPRNLDYIKPKKFKNYMTLGEVALSVEVDPSWLKKLEAEDRIPRAARVPLGKLKVRLWSPAQVEEIRQIIRRHKVGRPAQN